MTLPVEHPPDVYLMPRGPALDDLSLSDLGSLDCAGLLEFEHEPAGELLIGIARPVCHSSSLAADPRLSHNTTGAKGPATCPPGAGHHAEEPAAPAPLPGDPLL